MLFNIVMELKEKRAVVRLGKPFAPEVVIHLSFDDIEGGGIRNARLGPTKAFCFSICDS